MSGPWGLIGMIVNAGANNMRQTREGAERQEKSTYGVYNSTNKPAGLQMGQAPAMGSGARSPTAQIMEVTAGVPYQFQMSSPVGNALRGEESMLRATTPAVGGYMQGPMKVNSSAPSYNDSSLPEYIKRRGGFSL